MAITYEYKKHIIDLQTQAEKQMLFELENGNYCIENPLIKYNPYLLNCLSAVILFKTKEPTSICLRVIGKNSDADISHKFSANTTHVLPVLGLYSDYENKVEIYSLNNPSLKTICTIKVGKVVKDNLVEYMKTTPEYIKNNIIFLTPAQDDLAIGVDINGDIRFKFSESLIWDLKRNENGNFMMGSHRLVEMPYFISGIFEMSPVGKIYKEYRVPRGYHHDNCILDNGDIVALSCNYDDGTVEDQCVVIDKNTGEVKRTINFNKFLTPGESKSNSYSEDDWFHGNSIWYDSKTNSLTLSGRHYDAIVNIDYDSEKLNWIIGDDYGYSEETKKYMFTPVGNDFEWQYEQHSALITPKGDVMCFDNHHWGSKEADKFLSARDSYSRGVIYKIDTEKMSIKQLWQYGKERGYEFFSPYISNVEYYDENHYMIHSGGIAYDNNNEPSNDLGPQLMREIPGSRLESITVEVCSDKEVLELKCNSNFYRAKKMPLYHEGYDNLKLTKGVILGSLGVTPKTDVNLNLEISENEIPLEYDIKIIEEFDMFTFIGTFEKGQLVLVCLENEKETNNYYVPFTNGRRKAMCTSTFMNKDLKVIRKGITKEGLSGTYNLRIIVDDEKFETNIKIKC